MQCWQLVWAPQGWRALVPGQLGQQVVGAGAALADGMDLTIVNSTFVLVRSMGSQGASLQRLPLPLFQLGCCELITGDELLKGFGRLDPWGPASSPIPPGA
jgi:hypothetical protein